MLDNGKYHVSTEDYGLATRDKGVFQFDSFTKIEVVIKEAERQYKALLANKTEYKNYPFVIALDFDFFADSFDKISKSIYGLTNISAVIRIENDYELKNSLKNLSIDQLERLINKEIKIKLPPNTKKFKVLLNKNPVINFSASKFLKNPIIV